MEAWVKWARGPVFLFAFMFMLLGLIRHVVLTLFEMRRAMTQAGDKSIPLKKILIATLKWLFPMEAIKNRIVFSLTSIVFHFAILVVPIFLAGHIGLWTRGLGISWPAIPHDVADVLTLVGIISALTLVIERAAARDTRALSRIQDYVLPLIIAAPFASGFLVMHPSLNPFPYETTLFVHVMSANLVFVLIPLTKLTHAVLVPAVQLVSEIAWHWPPDAGTRVGETLGKAGEPI